MKVKDSIIVALIGALTLSLVSIVGAQDSTANVEVRVWQSTQDAERVYISARPEGGSWGETTRLAMSGLNSRETFRYEDITVAVPLSSGEVPNAPSEAETDGSPLCMWLIGMERYVDGFVVKFCEMGEGYEVWWGTAEAELNGETWTLSWSGTGAGGYFAPFKAADRSMACEEYAAWVATLSHLFTVESCEAELWIRDIDLRESAYETRTLTVEYVVTGSVGYGLSTGTIVAYMDPRFRLYAFKRASGEYVEIQYSNANTVVDLESGD